MCEKLIIGIGNRLRADDAVGSIVAERVAQFGLCSIDAEFMPENFIGVVRRYSPKKIIIVDASHMDLEPGQIRRIPLLSVDDLHVSTHNVSLATILHHLQEITRDITIIGVQPQNIEIGGPISKDVLQAIDVIVAHIVNGTEETIPFV